MDKDQRIEEVEQPTQQLNARRFQGQANSTRNAKKIYHTAVTSPANVAKVPHEPIKKYHNAV